MSRLAASEKQLLLSRLLARLAHEIRNPLSSLDVHVQLLEEDLGALDPAIRRKLAGRLEIIHGELHRLENIVRQFLRLAGPSSVDLAPVAIGDALRHVAQLLQPEAAARRITIITDVVPDLPLLSADADQLIQCFLNLAINALQAVGATGRVELQARAEEAELVIEVRDTGPGVPPDKVATIFEPYYTTKAEGSGIGLWIAQQIVIAHRGSLTAANAPAGGAVFTVRLPLRPPTPAHG